ncbi:hypothetical protein GQF61_08620 [Sphingobacterium sp. DK4209]|uniref:Uncharacterized protein n=1 Tax=Sphingobacterium zhuxiongii TaxID=2662364 RepID=A0A5Q0QJQ6_9SPHI|nr:MULTISPECIES: hypothetical protein [unclassified Sphingobacterium]MVZ65919.1 hypothetical protein [Sphingobacterium sp. DK4209]QGA28070.1 hypothetical protein GFH32_17815 [Sphingobacterium sp. dk4302]
MIRIFLLAFFWILSFSTFQILAQQKPSDIQFTRQAVKRIIFDEGQQIPLASLEPNAIVGMSAMHPDLSSDSSRLQVSLSKGLLQLKGKDEQSSRLWMSGFNPFACYSININDFLGKGYLGFEFADPMHKNRFQISIVGDNNQLNSVHVEIEREGKLLLDSNLIQAGKNKKLNGSKLILQMLGSGLVLYLQQEELPLVIAQLDYSNFLDLRDKKLIQSMQTALYSRLSQGEIQIEQAAMFLSSGMGLADIRAITYENGDPFIDQGRLWYTMTVRGRALPHHLQGVFSMNPSTFDIKFEGIIVFDRSDGILRNEVASHIFYDRKAAIWRGITTGFSAYANPQKEKKQLLAVESKKDPRFGYSIMQAEPFGQVGDIEDPHILYDEQAGKWRILTCENIQGYQAIMLESDVWNKQYKRIAGPVPHNSTGTSIQKIDGKLYCFSGSSAREIFIYSYPDLKEQGTLKMDLPPWDKEANTRTWPNVLQLPPGYPMKYIALMMDRFNYPGMKGPNWTYGALYLYYGY